MVISHSALGTRAPRGSLNSEGYRDSGYASGCWVRRLRRWYSRSKRPSLWMALYPPVASRGVPSGKKSLVVKTRRVSGPSS